MEIQCPSCQKKLAIGDQFAGQLIRCPACNGVFMAPSLVMPATPMATPVAPPVAPVVAPTVAPPFAAPDVIPFSGDAPPRPAYPPPPPRPAPPPPAILEEEPPLPPGDFKATHTLKLCPDVLRWVAPVALAVVFLCSFLGWVAEVAFTIRTSADGQSTQQLASTDLNLWHLAFSDRGTAAWILYAIFTVFLALPLAWVKLLMEKNLVPMPDLLKPYWQWRSVAVGAVAAVAYTFASIGWLQLTATQSTAFGLGLGLRAHLVALIACGLEFWLIHRKKRQLPLPEVTARW